MSKTVLITGAGSGFGKMSALALLERGHHVIAATETSAQAEALGEEYPALDVAKIDITTSDVAVVGRWEVDVLVNNAGVGQTGPLADIDVSRVRRLFEVNVFGTLSITQEVLKSMVARATGRVIIVSSIAGVLAAPTFGPYSMTKFALEAMGKTLRSELAGLGVDVTLLNPGPYNTGFNDRMAESMWEWFGESSLSAGAAGEFRAIGEFVTSNQMDPAQVAQRIVELVEAENTTENNFVPANLIELIPRL